MVALNPADYDLIAKVLEDYYLNATIYLSTGGVEIEISTNQKIIDQEEFENKICQLLYDEIFNEDDLDGNQLEISFSLEESKIVCEGYCNSVSYHDTSELIDGNEEFKKVITENVMANSEYFQLDISEIGFELDAVKFDVVFDVTNFREFEVYYYGDLVTLEDEYKEKLKNEVKSFFINESYPLEKVSVEFTNWDSTFEINSWSGILVEFIKE